MMVLVDTSVWSLALRRRQVDASPHAQELARLISDSRVQMIGPIRQEILSGIRNEPQFIILRDHLRNFPDLALSGADFEYAAELYNMMRARGIQGSNTDFLICAVSLLHALPVFTTDNDFALFATHVPLQLHAFTVSPHTAA